MLCARNMRYGSTAELGPSGLEEGSFKSYRKAKLPLQFTILPICLGFPACTAKGGIVIYVFEQPRQRSKAGIRRFPDIPGQHTRQKEDVDISYNIPELCIKPCKLFIFQPLSPITQLFCERYPRRHIKKSANLQIGDLRISITMIGFVIRCGARKWGAFGPLCSQESSRRLRR